MKPSQLIVKLSKRALSIPWESRFARRLVGIFIALAGVPLVVGVVMLGNVAQEQIVAAAKSMQRINSFAMQKAQGSFQHLATVTVRDSSSKVADISVKASQTVSREWQQSQLESISASTKEFAGITKSSIDDALHQSVGTNKDILGRLGRANSSLLTVSAQRIEEQSEARVGGAMQEQIDARMKEQATEVAQQVVDQIDNNLNYLSLTAQMLDLRADDPAKQKSILDALVRRFPMLSYVSVMDSHGHETAASASDHAVPATQLQDRSREKFFKEALQDRTYVGVEGLHKKNQAPVLRLAVPIELYRGHVVGALSAKLSLEDLWDSIRAIRIGASGFASVSGTGGEPLLAGLGKHGPLITQSADIAAVGWRISVAQPRAEVMQPATQLKASIHQSLQGTIQKMQAQIQRSSQDAASLLTANASALRAYTAGTADTRTRRVSDLLVARSAQQAKHQLAQMRTAIRTQADQALVSSDRQMALAVKDSSERLAASALPLIRSALMSAHKGLAIDSLTILIAACLLSSLIALVVADQVVRPIIRLAHGTRAIAEGNLDRRVDERAPDEIGDLAQAFNQMAKSLQSSMVELQGAEAQLVQSAKLASLGTLSAGVAHELNQPVAIVRGIAQQLLDDQDLSEDLKSDLVLIEGQTSRMMKIIKHLRTFCRSSGYETVEVDVNKVVQDCFILIDAQLKSHNIRSVLSLSKDLPTVIGDPNELEQVFLNLITNARDAMEGLHDPCLTISTWQVGESVVAQFSDNGPGISDQVIDRIFDPFFTTKEPGKGTGLGLSISHAIIQKHRGDISVTSDHGAVFRISLPIATSDKGADALPNAA